jgi:hypothetical protein
VPDDDAHYRRTFEFNPHTQWTALPTGELDRVSQRWEEWTGTSGLGGSWQDAMHRDDVERTWKVWKACLASGEEYESNTAPACATAAIAGCARAPRPGATTAARS